ncbi:MAG TPA: hypothetical protein VK457_15850 [Chloroflexota bacterium]|jgi:hypothetical protein|nr:hypothetical protein [Chloroflexota bacterium]
MRAPEMLAKQPFSRRFEYPHPSPLPPPRERGLLVLPLVDLSLLDQLK